MKLDYSPDRYVLSFSGGRTSAYMTHHLLQTEEYKDAVVIFCNTGKEEEETLRFVDNCNELWGGRVIWLEYIAEKPLYKVINYQTASRKGEPFEALIRKRKYLPNRVARFCTQELKIKTMKRYCVNVLGWKNWVNLVGIRYDEPRRWNKKEQKQRFTVEHPLVKMQVTKPMVLDFWRQMPFDLNLKEHEGNCDLCFLKGKAKKIMLLRDSPEKAEWWKAQEERTGASFHPEFRYADLQKMIADQPTLFEKEDTDSIPCFCNAD